MARGHHVLVVWVGLRPHLLPVPTPAHETHAYAGEIPSPDQVDADGSGSWGRGHPSFLLARNTHEKLPSIKLIFAI